jgi:hypothetical protein
MSLLSWIDVVLVAAGAALAAGNGRPVAGLVLVALGLVMPGLRLVTRHRTGGGGTAALTRLVPPELADAHADLRAAATLPGVPDAAEVVAAADHSLLEVAAALAGREPRGAAQRRLVAGRVAALRQVEDDLYAHHVAWREAVAEVDALAPTESEVGTAAPTSAGFAADRDGPMVTLMLILLSPLFLAWELVTGTLRALRALVDGVALRIRTAARAVRWALHAVGWLIAGAIRQWAALRRRVVAAAGEARARFIAARLRLRLRFRAQI